MIKSLLRFLVIVVILFFYLLHPNEITYAQISPIHPYFFEHIKKEAVQQATTSAQKKAVLGRKKIPEPSPTVYIYPTPTLFVLQEKPISPHSKKVYTPERTSSPSPFITGETKKTANPSTILSPTQIPPETNTEQSLIISQINAYRKSLGLPAVKENNATCDFAKIRADEIVASFNHDGFSQRIDAKNLPYTSWSTVVENIAMNTNANDVVSLWIKSPPHAENMRENTTYVCVRNTGSHFAYEGMTP